MKLNIRGLLHSSQKTGTYGEVYSGIFGSCLSGWQGFFSKYNFDKLILSSVRISYVYIGLICLFI